MPIDRNNAQYITGAIYKPTQTSAPGVWDLDDQANNIAKNLWPLPPQAVQRSLRFNSADSAYLSRIPLASNRRVWTFSCWLKRAKLSAPGTVHNILSTDYVSTNGHESRFDDNNSIKLADLASSNITWVLQTNALYRDCSAWYHIVIAFDSPQGTPSERVKLYVNGTQVTSFATATYPSLNYESYINSTLTHYIGGWANNGSPSRFYDGYIAEINFVDGQQLTATSFGETDPQTGVWIPKRYTGTYGTNGFRLSFANNSSTTALGYDSSGTGNNWTTNNFSVTPGVGNDVFVDVPSLYGTDTGLGGEVLGNYATLNPLSNPGGSTLSNGNLDVSTPNTTAGRVLSTMAVSSGKWYCEFTITNVGAGFRTGIVKDGFNNGDIIGNFANEYAYYSDGNKYSNSTAATYGVSYTTNDVIGVALDLDNGTLSFSKNGVSQGVAYTGIIGSYTFGICDITGGGSVAAIANFGQRPFAYPAPTGYKALCTTNLPAPAIGQTSSNQADNHFNVVTYTGNGTAQTITGVGFQPDLVWVKNRTGTQWHNLTDAVRGTNSQLYSNDTGVQGTASNALTSFNPDGFSVGSAGDWNGNGYSMVAWCWNAGGTPVSNTQGSITSSVSANQRAGFSILTYTGTGAAATIGHGLDSAPVFVIYKNRSVSSNWIVYSLAINNASQGLMLNSPNAVFTDSTPFNGVAPTSSLLTVGTNYQTNGNGNSIVAYCWKSVPGFSAFGSFSGTGSTDGAFVYTGFRPAFVMVKTSLNSTDNWYIDDIKRDTYNMSGLSLMPNLANAEAASVGGSYSFRMDMLSNGFKIRENYATTVSFIYAAFAETPARLSTAR